MLAGGAGLGSAGAVVLRGARETGAGPDPGVAAVTGPSSLVARPGRGRLLARGRGDARCPRRSRAACGTWVKSAAVDLIARGRDLALLHTEDPERSG